MRGEQAEILIGMLDASPVHCETLAAVASLGLPDCWIAAGFIRNHIWDVLHGYTTPTPLNDIDVVYFDAANHQNEDYEKEQEARLLSMMPGLPWSVKNQARMHIKNGDTPYRNSSHALEHWCETVTPIGARMTPDGIDLLAPLGVGDLLGYACRATPFARSKPSKLQDYRDRMREKQWWKIWPKIRVYDLD